MSIHYKIIDNSTSFCGLDTVTQNNEFTDYNVIFANNGVGKTSTTRAFELLINKNNHILKYQTINNSSKPKISFLLNNNSIINILISKIGYLLNVDSISINIAIVTLIYIIIFLMSVFPVILLKDNLSEKNLIRINSLIKKNLLKKKFK